MTTTSAVKQRLSRLERGLLPPAPQVCRLLEWPADPADDQGRRCLLSEANAAAGRGELVWVVGAPEEALETLPRCVAVVDERWKAELAILARLPSSEGRASALADVQGRLTGRIVEPAALTNVRHKWGARADFAITTADRP